jgi:hypothetical protein
MRMERLFFGVLRVLTPLGPRYLTPSLAERFYLLWIFCNFKILPIKVLNRRQQRRIEAMCPARICLGAAGEWTAGRSPARNL